jgi:hypothetical protein
VKTTATTGSHSTAPVTTTTNPSGGTGPVTPTVSLPPPAAASPSTGPSPIVASPPAETAVALGRTVGIGLGGGGLAVVVVMGVAIIGALGAPTTFFIGRKRGRW